MNHIIDIPWWQLALFATVLLVPLAINQHFQLGQGRTTLIAFARMTAQLALVGVYLKFVFTHDSLLLNLTWLAVMTLVGASAILGNSNLRHRRLVLPVLAGMVLSLLPVLGLLLLGLLQPAPWYSAQYLIPLAGMLLGNTLSGNVVAMRGYFGALKHDFSLYEGALALGCTPRYAARPFVRQAIKQAQAPQLANITATGLVTLPGMMTGQILAGTDPHIAIKYQLVIMIAIYVMLSLSVTITLLLGQRAVLAPTGQVLIPLPQED
ncbi:ABC transporter permease [Ferrimonas balearica]|uniref:ABC transporter permease n=1 Tax=Ferrimonas balearica TaxID=44012 RepID=UPI001F233853|nr:ABC transporter permease [Ferrimonas balearica]MBY6017717.1 ABC transporter permease [Halomonas denitrificans]MBY6094075.1 ABC transporter permease [Ferrimonas balearica]